MLAEFDLGHYNNTMFNHSVTDTPGLKNREEIDPQYTWNLSDIYKSNEDWEIDFHKVESLIPNYTKFKGKLTESAGNLLDYMKLTEEVDVLIERLHLYAMLNKDLDLRNGINTSRHDKLLGLASKVSSAGAFFLPELLAVDDSVLQSIIKDESLALYSHMFENILREKQHILSEKEEVILAEVAQIASVPKTTFSILTNADKKPPLIMGENGEEIELSGGVFSSALYSKNREYRARVYKEYLKFYVDFSNTLQVTLSGHLKIGNFYSKIRKFKSAKESALDNKNIPVDVYDNLIKALNQNFEPMHRWGEIKRKALGVEKIQPYDSYVNLFSNKSQKYYSYDEAVEIVINALSVLGEEYIADLKRAFENRWVDVYETKGKRSGAYSSGVTYGVHPYVLMNWNGTLNDVFTLAHEMGHNMHSYYSGTSQPYVYAHYTIFLAEIASTFNESLLLDYLISQAEDNDEKLVLIEMYLNNCTSTFFRQTMFAEFEETIYSKVEKQEELSVNVLREIYSSLYKKYWGPAMEVPIEEEYAWGRIPHFYYTFYVYQYATGFAASQALNHLVKTEGKPAIDRYLNFLKSGGCKYSIDIMKDAGVDLTTPAPVNAVLQNMSEMLDLLETLI